MKTISTLWDRAATSIGSLSSVTDPNHREDYRQLVNNPEANFRTVTQPGSARVRSWIEGRDQRRTRSTHLRNQTVVSRRQSLPEERMFSIRRCIGGAKRVASGLNAEYVADALGRCDRSARTIEASRSRLLRNKLIVEWSRSRVLRGESADLAYQRLTS